MPKQFFATKLVVGLSLILLTACAKQAQPLATPVLATSTSLRGYPPPQTPLPPPPTTTPVSYPPIPTLTPFPSATFGPSPTPFPTYPPLPTLIPTVNPTELPGLLLSSLRLESLENFNGHSLQRVTGWEYGIRQTSNCRSYGWLNDTHILFDPIVGEEEGMGVAQFSQPIVINLNNEQMWLPPVADLRSCGLPLWSESLQQLISRDTQGAVIHNADGQVIQYFPAGFDLSLSPSGKSLLTSSTWRNLETGKTIELNDRPQAWMTVWTLDEARVFDCCYSLADATTGQYTNFSLGQLQLVGRDGGDLYARWVLSDTRVVFHWDFTENDKYGMIPLIDPSTQTYQDIRVLAQLGSETSCGFPEIAPNGNYLIVGCGLPMAQLPPNRSLSYLIDLRTFISRPLSNDLQFINWSPDSSFALLAVNYNSQEQNRTYNLLPISGGDLIPLSTSPTLAPVWSPSSSHLAYLTEDGKSLITLEVATRASRIILLPQPFLNAIWHPQSNALALLASDGSLWWVPDFNADHVEQLTPPLPTPRDIHWGPSGTHLAFVSGPDIYIVAVAPQ